MPPPSMTICVSGVAKLGNHLQAGSARHNSGKRISRSIVGRQSDLHKLTMSGGDTGSNSVSLSAKRQAIRTVLDIDAARKENRAVAVGRRKNSHRANMPAGIRRVGLAAQQGGKR